MRRVVNNFVYLVIVPIQNDSYSMRLWSDTQMWIGSYGFFLLIFLISLLPCIFTLKYWKGEWTYLILDCRFQSGMIVHHQTPEGSFSG
jgi:hypothetical protein